MIEGRGMPAGIAIGAGLMYFLDPEKGRRRRALVRDKVNASWNRSSHLLAMAQRDAAHRTQGIIAEARAMISSGQVPDEILIQRVRSRLGRFASRPRALEISADNGIIHVSGPILQQEVDTVLNAIRTTRGVIDVIPSLEIHETPDNVPALQGGGEPMGDRPDFLQKNWAPATRVIGTIAGGALLLIGTRMGRPTGVGVAAAGLMLAVRSITNFEIRKVIGIGSGTEGIDVRKTININAPLQDVFRLWANPENYSRFMEHVRSVQKTGDGQYHWVVEGPGGSTFEWDAVITEYEASKKIGWKTVPGAPVPQSGFTRLDQNPDGSTRLDVHMTYTPPGGLIGHTVASIFGGNPRQQMNDDLVRFQTLMEAGKTTAKGQEVTRDQLVADVQQSGDREQESRPEPGS